MIRLMDLDDDLFNVFAFNEGNYYSPWWVWSDCQEWFLVWLQLFCWTWWTFSLILKYVFVWLFDRSSDRKHILAIDEIISGNVSWLIPLEIWVHSPLKLIGSQLISLRQLILKFAKRAVVVNLLIRTQAAAVARSKDYQCDICRLIIILMSCLADCSSLEAGFSFNKELWPVFIIRSFTFEVKWLTLFLNRHILPCIEQNLRRPFHFVFVGCRQLLIINLIVY